VEGQGQNIDEFQYFKRWSKRLERAPRCNAAWQSAPIFSVDISKLSADEIERLAHRMPTTARPAPRRGRAPLTRLWCSRLGCTTNAPAQRRTGTRESKVPCTGAR